MAIAGGGAAAAGTIAAGAGAVVVGGTVAGIGAVISGLGITVLFASDNRPGNNKTQNKQFRDVAREAGLDVNDPQIWDDLVEVHRYIRKTKKNLGFKELVNLIKEFLG